MAEKLEDEYLDVLQNIEFALVQTYREHEEMTDFDALEAMDALIRTYRAEASGHTPPTLRLNPFAEEAYNRVKAICEWRLGRNPLLDEDDQPVDLEMEPKTVDEILMCLRRIRKSIEFWQMEWGKRGYFKFVNQFLP